MLFAIMLPIFLPMSQISGQQASHTGEAVVVPSGKGQWIPSKGLAGAFYLPLVGQGSKPGVYVYRLKAPSGSLVPPHWHNQTMHISVLSGTLMAVMGAPFDSSRAQRLRTGSFLSMPAGMEHMEWFEGETVVHVETKGPLETKFLNPADDPQRRLQP
jgi:quercetin dioxygenase-like cupin family protein